MEVSVVKQDAETKTVVAGAEFGIYAKEDILAHEEVIVKADTYLEKQSVGKMERQYLTLTFHLVLTISKNLQLRQGMSLLLRLWK